MSTLITSNISDGTDTVGTEYVVNGSAKSWVNFNGTGTIATRDSLNVSSLTDNGTGDYTVNFSSAFGAADYSFSGCGRFDETSADVNVPTLGLFRTAGSQAVGSLRFKATANTFISAADIDIASVVTHGDLA